jgi:hypothetical protein
MLCAGLPTPHSIVRVAMADSLIDNQKTTAVSEIIMPPDSDLEHRRADVLSEGGDASFETAAESAGACLRHIDLHEEDGLLPGDTLYCCAHEDDR